MTNKDLFEALRTFEKEKGIPMDYMLQNIEKAISVACKNCLLYTSPSPRDS